VFCVRGWRGALFKAGFLGPGLKKRERNTRLKSAHGILAFSGGTALALLRHAQEKKHIGLVLNLGRF